MREPLYSEEDWKRDSREMDRVQEMQERGEREDGVQVEERRVPRMAKKKFVKVRFLTDLPSPANCGDGNEGIFKVGEEREIIDWIAVSWIERGIVEKVEEKK